MNEYPLLDKIIDDLEVLTGLHNTNVLDDLLRDELRTYLSGMMQGFYYNEDYVNEANKFLRNKQKNVES